MRDYTLNDEELDIIEHAMNHAPEAEVRQRATAIHLLHQQHKPKVVAETLAVTLASIYGWYRRWREEGIAGLKKRPYGRPNHTDDRYHRLVEEVLAHEPSEYGYTFPFWTVDRLREHMRRKTGIKLSKRRFRVLLIKKGYIYRPPNQNLQDTEAVDQPQNLAIWVKKSDA